MSHQPEEAKQANGKSEKEQKDKVNGKINSPSKQDGIALKKKEKFEKRKKKVHDLLTQSTSVKEENIYMDAFERLQMIELDKENATNIQKFKHLVKINGLQKDDPRIIFAMQNLEQFEKEKKDLDFESFKEVFQPCFSIIKKILDNQFTFQDYVEQHKMAEEIFKEVKKIEDNGFIPDYIPALKDVDENGLAVSICTVDGQMINLGNYNEKTCMHAISGAISYLLALQQLGEEELKNYIGSEPSGNQFNALELMANGIPHNPLNCAGSLMSSALIYKGESNAKKYENFHNVVKKMIGGRKVNFNNEMFLSEVDHAHANYALLYMMEETKALPEGTNIKQTLSFYTQCCSLSLRIQDLAVLAATLANGGI
jgi:glutaminase